MSTGWRALIDDARRVYWLLGVVGAVGAAIWAGTYWGWWAYMWDIALPVRVVGALAVLATVFVIWYGLLFTFYYYLGFPKKNPFVQPTSDWSSPLPELNFRTHDFVEDDTYRMTIMNNGPTDTFATQVTYISGLSQDQGPLALRWRGSQQETREIIKGHTQELELLRVTHTKAAQQVPEGRFNIDRIFLLTPTGEHDLPIYRQRNRLANFTVSFQVTSVASGANNRYRAHIHIATDGHSPPVVSTVLQAGE
jgi:hypothetical protein